MLIHIEAKIIQWVFAGKLIGRSEVSIIAILEDFENSRCKPLCSKSRSDARKSEGKLNFAT